MITGNAWNCTDMTDATKIFIYGVLMFSKGNQMFILTAHITKNALTDTRTMLIVNHNILNKFHNLIFIKVFGKSEF